MPLLFPFFHPPLKDQKQSCEVLCFFRGKGEDRLSYRNVTRMLNPKTETSLRKRYRQVT
uniref:Uncharacterized protein n=1 Tax=Rhizophora mucronata TaxID=61149 RepID=A0A2P2P6E3_RHIMU